MEQIRERVLGIIEKYNLKPIELPKEHKDVYSFINENQEREKDFKPEISDNELGVKYARHIPRGWYGFDIGIPIVPDWMKIISEITELCVSIDPKFEIRQVKLKYGRICYYASSFIIEDADELDDILNDKLYDKALVY